MSDQHTRAPGGVEVWRCLSFGKSEPVCWECRQPATRLCDGRLDGGTCDAFLCAAHSLRSGAKDFCAVHRLIQETGA